MDVALCSCTLLLSPVLPSNSHHEDQEGLHRISQTWTTGCENADKGDRVIGLDLTLWLCRPHLQLLYTRLFLLSCHPFPSSLVFVSGNYTCMVTHLSLNFASSRWAG